MAHRPHLTLAFLVMANEKDKPHTSSNDSETGGLQPDSGSFGLYCARCGGLMMIQHYMDMRDDTGQIDFTALRCAICGEVVDPVILKNRLSPPPNLTYGTKKRTFMQRVGGPHDTTQPARGGEKDNAPALDTHDQSPDDTKKATESDDGGSAR